MRDGLELSTALVCFIQTVGDLCASNDEIHAGAALADVTFAQRCVPLGWSGLEFLIGVPGCIGGAIAMNRRCSW